MSVIRRLARGAGAGLAWYLITVAFIGSMTAPAWWPRLPYSVQEGIAIFLVVSGLLLIFIGIPLYLAYMFGEQE